MAISIIPFNLLLLPSQPLFSCTSTSNGPNQLKKKHKLQHQYCVVAKASSSSSSSGNWGFRNKKVSSFNHRSSANVPLHEIHEDSFDQYMEEKGRVIRAIFPEKSTTLQLNEEEWRVKMPPKQALFLTFQPIFDIEARCISNEEDYPPEIPQHVTKILEINITRWELEGLDANYIPSDFNMKGRGALYKENQGRYSWIKNQIDLNLSLVFSPLLAWVPEYVLQSVFHSVLRNYLDDINKGFSVRLLADYDSFKSNRQKN